MFQFFSNKNISTGEGGMIVTDNEEIFKKVVLLRSHGMTTMSYQRATGHATQYDIVDMGYNYRLDDIRASLGIVQLDKLKRDLEKRAMVREWYINELLDTDDLIVPFSSHVGFVSNYIFPVVLTGGSIEKRDAVRSELSRRGIQTSVHYPAIHRFSAYAQYRRTLPKTEYVADNEITLPMYANLSREQVSYICDCLKDSLRCIYHGF